MISGLIFISTTLPIEYVISNIEQNTPKAAQSIFKLEIVLPLNY